MACFGTPLDQVAEPLDGRWATRWREWPPPRAWSWWRHVHPGRGRPGGPTRCWSPAPVSRPPTTNPPRRRLRLRRVDTVAGGPESSRWTWTASGWAWPPATTCGPPWPERDVQRARANQEHAWRSSGPRRSAVAVGVNPLHEASPPTVPGLPSPAPGAPAGRCEAEQNLVAVNAQSVLAIATSIPLQPDERRWFRER